MNTFTAMQEGPAFRANEMACPYNGINVCMASFSLMAIDTKKDNCCSTDDYDNCPIFLSKVLRRR